MKLEYHPDIEPVLSQIQRNCDDSEIGFGFIGEYQRHVLAMAASPGLWKVALLDIRQCVMKRYPYMTYFRRVDAERIRIVVVRFQRREVSRRELRKGVLSAECVRDALTLFCKPFPEMDDATAIALAHERDRQLESGEVEPIFHDEMMRRLRR